MDRPSEQIGCVSVTRDGGARQTSTGSLASAGALVEAVKGKRMVPRDEQAVAGDRVPVSGGVVIGRLQVAAATLAVGHDWGAGA